MNSPGCISRVFISQDADDGSAFTPATQPGTVTVAESGAGSDADQSTGGSAADGAGAESTANDVPRSPVLPLIATGIVAAAGAQRRD
nr:hypothetical protein [Halorubrum persicum]